MDRKAAEEPTLGLSATTTTQRGTPRRTRSKPEICEDMAYSQRDVDDLA
jgi:hypothetical protein